MGFMGFKVSGFGFRAGGGGGLRGGVVGLGACGEFVG